MAIEATLEYFNHRYPWPEEVISINKPVEFIFTFESELNVDVLWPYIADTNLLAKFGGGENMLRWMVDYMEKIPDPILVRRFSIS